MTIKSYRGEKSIRSDISFVRIVQNCTLSTVPGTFVIIIKLYIYFIVFIDRFFFII